MLLSKQLVFCCFLLFFGFPSYAKASEGKGGMPERPNGAVSKTVMPSPASEVRILLPPQQILRTKFEVISNWQLVIWKIQNT